MLHADYLLSSRSDRELPILWSLHPALRPEPGGRIELPGVTAIRATFITGWPVGPADDLAWPAPAAGVDLSVVPGPGVPAAAKLYAPTTLGRIVAPDGAWLEVAGEGASLASMGVWLDHGAWPAGGPPVHQLAPRADQLSRRPSRGGARPPARLAFAGPWDAHVARADGVGSADSHRRMTGATLRASLAGQDHVPQGGA